MAGRPLAHHHHPRPQVRPFGGGGAWADGRLGGLGFVGGGAVSAWDIAGAAMTSIGGGWLVIKLYQEPWREGEPVEQTKGRWLARCMVCAFAFWFAFCIARLFGAHA